MVYLGSGGGWMCLIACIHTSQGLTPAVAGRAASGAGTGACL